MRTRIPVTTIVMFVAYSTVCTHALGQNTGRPFHAGASTTNISPWLGLSINGNMADVKTRVVHDELHARALAFDDGKSRVAVVICDSCMIPRETVEKAKARIRARTGLDPERVLIAATHSHSCPTAGSVFQSDPDPRYLEFLAVRIADAVEQAFTNLAPAEIAWGAGKDDRQVFNRRWRMKPGTIPPDPFGNRKDTVQTNPAPGSPNLVEPAGPIDPELSIISLRGANGRPLAMLANYSLHYVGGVGGGHASADYFGAFADRVTNILEADLLDPPFVAAMSNGTSGDINNINFRTPRASSPPYAQISFVAGELADVAVHVSRGLKFQTHAGVDARTAELNLGVRRPDRSEVDRARGILAKAQGRGLGTMEELYARETVLLASYPKTVPVTVQALRIGELGIVAIPCEVFAEIGLEIKAKSPLKSTFTIELANGYNGYLPTRGQQALGGYETWRARSSYLVDDAAETITAKVLELLRGLDAARKSDVGR